MDFDVTVPTPQVVEVSVGGRGPAGPSGPQGQPGPVGPVAPVYYGQMSRTTSGNVTIAQTGTYVTTGLTGTLDGQNDGLVLGVNDPCGLRNVSGERILVRFYGSADIQAKNNHVVGLKFALNGIPIDATECRSHTGIGAANFAKTVISWMIAVEPDDEISLFIADFTDAGTAAVQRCRLIGVSVATL